MCRFWLLTYHFLNDDSNVSKWDFCGRTSSLTFPAEEWPSIVVVDVRCRVYLVAFVLFLSSVDSTGGSLVKVPRQGHGRMARAPNRWPFPWQSRKAETIRPVSSFATRKYVNEWIISRRPLPSHSQIGIGGQNGQTENIWERFIRKIGLWILKVLKVDTSKISTINTVGQILNHFIWIDSPWKALQLGFWAQRDQMKWYVVKLRQNSWSRCPFFSTFACFYKFATNVLAGSYHTQKIFYRTVNGLSNCFCLDEIW